MEKTILDFCEDCLCRGYTPHTLHTYKSNVRYFLQYTDNPSIVTMDMLAKFLKHLQHKNLADSTLNGYFSAISAYFDYLVWFKKLESNPVPAFRKRYLRFKKKYNGKNTRQLISTEQMRDLVYLPLTMKPTYIKDYLYSAPRRDHSILMMFAKTGMRKTELWSIQMDDIDTNEGTIRIGPFAKRCNCLAYMDQEGIEALTKYLSWRQETAKEGNTSLWVSHTGHKMRNDHIYDIVVFYAKILGIHDPNGDLIRRFGPHCFRHWFTTHLRRQGMDRSHLMWLRGDAPEGAIDLYDHVEPLDVLGDYNECMPRLW